MRFAVIDWLLRGVIIITGVLLLSTSAPVWAHADGTSITILRSASCSCCTQWEDHIAAAGFAINDVVTDEMDQVKQQLDIPDELTSCHTALVENYVVEGHVPARSIQRLLKERPDIKGITAPGMPMGSPGMDGPGISPEAFDVLAIRADGGTPVFDRFTP